MSQTRILQGRPISDKEVEQIRTLIAEHPQAHRRRLSQLLCQAWDWKNERGQSKDMAARSLMLKLQELGWIRLPPVRRPATNAQRGQRLPSVPAPAPRWEGSLASLRPLKLELILPGAKHRDLFHGLLAHYHYLGYRGPTGENLQYLAWSATGQVLACLVFDAAAWKVAARDSGIAGWSGHLPIDPLLCGGSPITAGSSLCPGFEWRICPVICWP